MSNVFRTNVMFVVKPLLLSNWLVAWGVLCGYGCALDLTNPVQCHQPLAGAKHQDHTDLNHGAVKLSYGKLSG